MIYWILLVVMIISSGILFYERPSVRRYGRPYEISESEYPFRSIKITGYSSLEPGVTKTIYEFKDGSKTEAVHKEGITKNYHYDKNGNKLN